MYDLWAVELCWSCIRSYIVLGKMSSLFWWALSFVRLESGEDYPSPDPVGGTATDTLRETPSAPSRPHDSRSHQGPQKGLRLKVSHRQKNQKVHAARSFRIGRIFRETERKKHWIYKTANKAEHIFSWVHWKKNQTQTRKVQFSVSSVYNRSKHCHKLLRFEEVLWKQFTAF